MVASLGTALPSQRPSPATSTDLRRTRRPRRENGGAAAAAQGLGSGGRPQALQALQAQRHRRRGRREAAGAGGSGRTQRTVGPCHRDRKQKRNEQRRQRQPGRSHSRGEGGGGRGQLLQVGGGDGGKGGHPALGEVEKATAMAREESRGHMTGRVPVLTRPGPTLPVGWQVPCPGAGGRAREASQQGSAQERGAHPGGAAAPRPTWARRSGGPVF